MAFDSITSHTKDFAKKKKVNRSAKLKQCKLDARRQQWLSQVKNKGNKEEQNADSEMHVSATHGNNERVCAVKILEINRGSGETDGLVHHYSDSDSSFHSPTRHSSSVMGSNCSGSSFTGSASSSSSSSSGRSYNGNISEEDDDGCSDDWEAVADALAATDDKQHQEQLQANQESPVEHENITNFDSPPELLNCQASAVDISKHSTEISRAWRPDDTFRPQSLPNLFKHHSFPMKLDRHSGHGGMSWASKIGKTTPSSCPICCEDLDFTDSSFLPCSCGFRLCLFCHKRILEEDGRCPGCRKQYEHDTSGAEQSLCHS